MQGKLLGIMGADFETTGQLLILYSAFVKYLRKMGIKRSNVQVIYRLQNGL